MSLQEVHSRRFAQSLVREWRLRASERESSGTREADEMCGGVVSERQRAHC
jgi:hypothetical protein